MKTENHNPQFTLEDLYASPFTYERKFRPDGSYYWEELTNLAPVTGIHVLDDFLRYLRAGNRMAKSIAKRIDVSPADLNIFLKILTGETTSDFIRMYLLRQACDMLKYTDLNVDEIAKHCSFGNNSNLTQSFTPVMGVTPRIYRYEHQSKLDRGRFRIE